MTIESSLVKMAVTSMILVALSAYLAQYSRQVAAAGVEARDQELYGALWLYPAGHIMNVSYSADNEPEYFGEAMPGALDSEASWRIYRYEYETIGGDPEIIGVRFAEGNTNFDKVWSDRKEYEYS